MRVINIIESIKENPVLSIESFGVYEEQLSQDVVDEAEELFETKAKENGMTEEDLESSLDDGFYENGDYTVSIVWSNI